jgi:cell division protein ZapA
MQDYIAMALIWFATEQTKESITVVSRNETINKLNQISLMLDKALAQK